MKKLFTLLTTVLFTVAIWAQSPEQISYQAVIRDTEGNLVQNQNVGIQISILQGDVTGSSVYMEVHSMSTNTNGLISLSIGSGVSSDDFSSINWANGPYFIKTETDPNGGTDYSISGTSQLLSVPYSLHSKTAENGISEEQSLAITSLLSKVESLERRIRILEGDYISEFTVQENLNLGIKILTILENVPVDSLYGKTHEGGLIFYVNEIDGTGLVAAPTDQATYDRDSQTGGVQWGCSQTIISEADQDIINTGGTQNTLGSSIGTGFQNTLDILSKCNESNTAAKICADLVLNDKDDWFLPSKDEFTAMRTNLQGKRANFNDFYYWTSTEYYLHLEYYVWAYYDYSDLKPKDFKHNVRAIRAF